MLLYKAEMCVWIYGIYAMWIYAIYWELSSCSPTQRLWFFPLESGLNFVPCKVTEINVIHTKTHCGHSVRVPGTK